MQILFILGIIHCIWNIFPSFTSYFVIMSVHICVVSVFFECLFSLFKTLKIIVIYIFSDFFIIYFLSKWTLLNLITLIRTFTDYTVALWKKTHMGGFIWSWSCCFSYQTNGTVMEHLLTKLMGCFLFFVTRSVWLH